MGVELVVPAMGESIREGTVAKWLKKVGESVQRDEPVVELDTDKVSVQVPSPAAGVLVEQRVQAGETVKVGQAIGAIDSTATAPKAPERPKTVRLQAPKLEAKAV